VAFITLCKAYMEIEPHFNLWNYLFRIQLLQGSGMDAAVCCCMDISIQFGQGINPYFHLLRSNPPVGWQREWFFLRNVADVPLPMFTGNRSAPQPSWGMWWLDGTSTSLQPLCDVVQQL
jgi:hypothetical protein